ncbi:MAG: hypothetical protein M0P94_01385 [Candidatus Absconditabacterales bacterium]|nr:hypothetical protein [Candidatus Absconditabacterales bacterium]
MDNKINDKIDYQVILQTIASYLVSAKENFGDQEKNNYSIGLIPKLDDIYINPLKALGYYLLEAKDTLILISKGSNKNKIIALGDTGEVFMGKKRGEARKILDILEENSIVELIAHKFNWTGREIPFVRIISNYKNLVFLEIGNLISKTKLVKLLTDLQEHANLLFISDLNSAKSSKSCKELDNKILDGELENKDLFIVDLFLLLTKKLSKKPKFAGYFNVGGVIKNNEKDFLGFGTIMA